MNEVTVYTDGSCFLNPGYGGWAAILQSEQHGEVVLQGGYELTTNNRMEMMGILRAMEYLGKAHPCVITLYSDSEYVVKGINQWMHSWAKKGWQRKNADLWKQLYHWAHIHKLKAEWVRGHSGHIMNERCDRLANAQALSRATDQDEGYEGTSAVPEREFFELYVPHLDAAFERALSDGE